MKPDRKKGQPKNPASTDPRRPSRPRAEDAEPSAQPGGLPVWPFIALAVLLFWGMLYLDNNAGGFNSLVYPRFASSNELARLVPVPPGGERVQRGMLVYTRPTCVACHQPNGMGTPPQFPPLAGAEWVNESDPARLIRIVLHGLQGPIQVKGETYNNVMLPWKDVLDDEEIADVLSYIRKSWGNDAPIVTTEAVTAVREETAGRNTAWTAEELLQIPVGSN